MQMSFARKRDMITVRPLGVEAIIFGTMSDFEEWNLVLFTSVVLPHSWVRSKFLHAKHCKSCNVRKHLVHTLKAQSC